MNWIISLVSMANLSPKNELKNGTQTAIYLFFTFSFYELVVLFLFMITHTHKHMWDTNQCNSVEGILCNFWALSSRHFTGFILLSLEILLWYPHIWVALTCLMEKKSQGARQVNSAEALQSNHRHQQALIKTHEWGHFGLLSPNKAVKCTALWRSLGKNSRNPACWAQSKLIFRILT